MEKEQRQLKRSPS